jgi:predicted ATPase
VLSDSVCELRKALGDAPRAPRFVETIHGRGFRFIAPVTPATASAAADARDEPFPMASRGRSLERLGRLAARAFAGERQFVFVTGEAGIGKTTLVETFLNRLPSAHGLQLLVARGLCLDHLTTGEPFLPILEALGRLCRSGEGERVVAILRRCAPLWLAELPSFVTENDLESLPRGIAGATRERMLREMAEALEELAARVPLVLWLEDLHASDDATLDLLAFVARRAGTARLLVLATQRPLAGKSDHLLHAVQQDARIRDRWHELAIEPLDEAAVEDVLAARLAIRAVAPPARRELARIVHRRTGGNPLFVASLVKESLTPHETLESLSEAARRAVPESLGRFIERQVERLSPADRELLEVAALVGTECASAAIAAGLGEDVAATERRGADLSRRESFLREDDDDKWPDGTITTVYRFTHEICRDVLAARVTAARRAALEGRIRRRFDLAYGRGAARDSA